MAEEKFSNFLTDIIDADLAEGKVDVVHTRFPPEPNGYLHIGSAKAIFINYTIAKHYGGLFNLRFDDTNPAREGDEYVQSILQDLKWLGAEPNGGIFYGSDYFERCYEYAEQLIKEGKAYVDDLTREQGFYEKNPGADTATRQMLNKPPLPFTKGLRLGNMPQIRVIVDEELESVWTGKKTPQQALECS